MSPLAGEVARLVCDLTGMDRATLFAPGRKQCRRRCGRPEPSPAGNSSSCSRDYHGNFDEVLVRVLGGRAATDPASRRVQSRSARPRLRFAPSAGRDPRSSDRTRGRFGRTRAKPPARIATSPFFHEVRNITARSGTALIFDEVITGFRLHPGGAQASSAWQETSRLTAR